MTILQTLALPLALLQGSFENFQKCQIYQDHVKLHLGHDFGNQITTQFPYTGHTDEILQLTPGAIAGIGPVRYRWMLEQTDYQVLSAQNELITFLSSGITNRLNDSVEAKRLKELMHEICESDNYSPKILGEFIVLLRIGNRDFTDRLIIEKVTESTIKGRYIVPGSFESEVESLIADDKLFSFKIRVREGEDDYYAEFKGAIESDGSLEGSAYELGTQQLLGHFTAARLHHEQ